MRKRRARPSRQELFEHRVAVWPDDERCPLCLRPMVRGRTINKHHLVPKFYGGTEQFFLHRVCHDKIHAVFSEKDLARHFHTFKRLREHPAILKFVAWIAKQDCEFITSHRHVR